jgi:hypothetical protein
MMGKLMKEMARVRKNDKKKQKKRKKNQYRQKKKRMKTDDKTCEVIRILWETKLFTTLMSIGAEATVVRVVRVV